MTVEDEYLAEIYQLAVAPSSYAVGPHSNFREAWSMAMIAADSNPDYLFEKLPEQIKLAQKERDAIAAIEPPDEYRDTHSRILHTLDYCLDSGQDVLEVMSYQPNNYREINSKRVLAGYCAARLEYRAEYFYCRKWSCGEE